MSENKTSFSEKFILWFSVYVFTGAGLFLWKAAFIPKESINDTTKYIVGFVTGSIISVVITYLYGSSKSSAEKDKRLGSLEVPEKSNKI